MRFRFVGFVVLVLLACGGALYAQVTASATLQGTILDKQQAVVVGATITVTSKTTGLTRTATSNEFGAYRLDQLPVGVYDIQVSASGFATVTAERVELRIGQNSGVDFSLSPGVQTETMIITGEAPVIDSQKTYVGLNITPTEVRDLPLNGRDFANLAVLAPGAKPVNSYDPTKQRYAVFGINGSTGRNVNVTVNGIDNKDNTVGGPVMQLPLEAVQEFVISTQRFSAANGRSEGAALNVVTKSGANQFHGSAYLFERNERLNAKNFFEDSAGLDKSPFSRQQFGGSIGGPLVKDKAFFFFTLERTREITSIVADPNAVKELNLVTGLGAQPASAIPTPYFDWRYNGRLDYRFNEKHNVFLSYTAQTNRGLNDQITQTSDLTAGNFTKNELQIANLTLNSVLSARTVNAFTLGFQYWNNLIDSEKKVPTFNFPAGVTFGTNTNVPQQSYQRKWQFKDDLSIIVGKHGLKTGFDYVWEPQLGGFFEFNPTLALTFLDSPSVILGNKTKYPQGFATPGAVVGMSATAGNPYFNLPGGAKMFGLYFQDDWRVSRRLTLNLGLRWDKDFNLIGAEAQSKSRAYLILKAINSPFANRLPEDDNKDFSPRFGFAFDATGTGRHVIRGGYGIYYGQVFLNTPLFMIQQANPTIFATVFSVNSAGPGDTGCVAPACLVPGTNILLRNWRFGVDPLPTIPPPPTNLLNGATGRIMDPSTKNPYTQQWNIGYSYRLTTSSVIEVEYVHVLGLREYRRTNINPVRVNDPANPTAPRLAGARQMASVFAAAGQPLLGTVTVDQSTGRSRYDGLNISFRQRMTHRLSFNTSYVLSRALAYNGNIAAFGNVATDLDDAFAGHDFGPAGNDERHHWVLSGIVNLPRGFDFAPILQLASPRPYNLTQGLAYFGYGGGSGAAHLVVLNDRPNEFLATKDFSAAQLRACLAGNTCHQVPFNAVRGQTFFQWDVRVSKSIKFGERANLKLIFQAFDLTNRANFGANFVGSVRAPNFRQVNGFITPAGVIVPRQFSGEIGAQFVF